MVRQIKLALLRTLKTAGVFEIVANTKWRTQRLLILCYHGIALEDEHLWRPQLYMPPLVLERRLKSLQKMRCSIMPLGEALTRLQANDLPSRSVAVTFDDGTYDFYKQAFPLLQGYQIPATVYQTTYYSDHEYRSSISSARTCCGSGAASSCLQCPNGVFPILLI